MSVGRVSSEVHKTTLKLCLFRDGTRLVVEASNGGVSVLAGRRVLVDRGSLGFLIDLVLVQGKVRDHGGKLLLLHRPIQSIILRVAH